MKSVQSQTFLSIVFNANVQALIIPLWPFWQIQLTMQSVFSISEDKKRERVKHHSV